MSSGLETALAEALSAELVRLEPVRGGDICLAYRAALSDGRRVFVKTRAAAPSGFFAYEAAGLEWLRAARSLCVPAVLGYADAPLEPFLALEWIEPTTGRQTAADFDVELGRGLAALHRTGADGYGFAIDGFIGPLPQANSQRATWAEFLREQRLEPLIQKAHAAGLLDPALLRRLHDLLARLEQLVGPDEPPARLHGDLWSGNVLCDARGRPWIVDPAAYGGHREVDLAMLSLFGAPSARFLAAYHEAFPLAPEHAQRVALYQIHPLLVHLTLFGRAYHDRLDTAVRRYIR